MIKTKKLNITFTSKNRTTPIGFKFLVDIVKNLEDIKENEFIFDLLSHSHISAIREEIALKDNLSLQTIEYLLNDSNETTINNLLHRQDTLNKLNTKQILKIIKSNNIKFIKIIAMTIEYLKKCDVEKIIKKLSKHDDPIVREALLYNVAVISNKYLEILLNDEEIDIRKIVLERFNKIRHNSVLID